MSRLLYIPSVNIFTSIKYGYLYNWWAASNPATNEYGYLYNWYAIGDARNICSDGWRVPSLSDYNTLITYLGGNSIAGGKLKETGTAHWDNPNTGATNEVGFNARGSGMRITSGTFGGIKTQCYLWTTTVFATTPPQYRKMTITVTNATISNSLYQRNEGNAIRVIKDSTTLTNGQTGTYTGNDGKIYRTICIGTQEWLSENLMETKYRNGDQIPEVTDNTAWAALTTGARCVYNNTLSNAGTGNAITSSDDWVVASLNDYNILGFIPAQQGGKFKETGNTYWDSPNTGATNLTNFNARGSGYRENGVFSGIKQFYIVWTSTSGYYLQLRYNTSICYSSAGGADPKLGGSIRLLYVGSGTPTNYIGNDGKIYRIVQIGTQWWLADNLAETKYRDGSTIPVVTDNTAWSALITGARCVYNNDESNM